MFDSLILCIVAGVAICVYMYFNQKSKKAGNAVDESNTEDKAEDRIRSAKWLEITVWGLLTFVISLYFASCMNGEGVTYKIGVWVGNVLTAIVPTGVVVGVRYLIKKSVTWRFFMNTLWIIGILVYALGFYSYGNI